jgi:hypothetical protein
MRRFLLLLVAIAFISAPVRPNVRVVRAGDDLQAALNAARAGDEIRLQAGATFSGSYVLPVFQGDGAVTLRTEPADGVPEAAGQRITPAASSRLAKIVSPSSEAALRTAPGAHGWRLMLIELPANKGGFGDIVQIGDGSGAQSTLEQVPHDIVLDRLYIHGDAEAGQKRGVALNGRNVTIVNCHISDIKAIGADAQAIGGWNGPGPFTIENNYLEAAGEVILFGGADPAIPNLVPTDLVVRYNHVTRPMSWRGSKWQVKNLFELKNARHARIEWNLFENNWQAAQPGYAILFTPRNQDGKCPWCVIEDVTFAHNIVRNSSAGVNVLGHDSPNPSGLTHGVKIEDNLFTGISTKLGGNGWGVLVGDGPSDLVIDHNTFELDGTTILYAYGKPKLAGFQFTNNAAPHGTYGINGAGASTGTLALQTFFDDPVVTGNWLSGGPSGKYPKGNRFDGGFDPAHAAPAGADIAQLLPLLDSVPKGTAAAAISSAK